MASSNITTQISDGDNLIAALIMLIPSSVSVCFQILIIRSLCLIWRKSKNDFYLLLISLSSIECTLLSCYVVYSAPATFLERPLFGRVFDSKILGTANNALYMSSMAMYMNIGLNRFLSVCRHLTYKTTYDRKKLISSICVCFTFGFLSSIPQLTPCCSMLYLENQYSWTFDRDGSGFYQYIWYDRFVVAFTCIPLAIMYGSIVRKIRKIRAVTNSLTNNGSDEKRDRTDQYLAIQSAIIFTLALTSGLAFTIVPLFATSKWACLSTTMSWMISAGTQPVVYYYFNPLVRNEVNQIFARNRENNEIQQLNNVDCINTKNDENARAKIPCNTC